ncbi:unnamed protein product [Linum tenue]|uniref:Interferon-related developmental regulator 1 n=1 Tax=Linum tenue TaxID=586396 RepID=A0AAV0I7A8_9ROSI|nr:unnamed protein product [Linum tenue]
MGKRSNRKKNASMLESDDDDSSVSSSSTVRSDLISVTGNEEVEIEKDNLLDQALDALYEKRSTTRERALASIVEAFNTNLQHEFVEKKFATLLHQCVSCIKKGSSKEIALASHAIGLLALTVGFKDNTHEIFEELIAPISQSLKSGSDSLRRVALVECLAIVTFICGNGPEETEQSMLIMWQLVRPKLGPNVVGVKPSSPVITAVASAWAFLLTSMDGWTLNPKDWQECISYFSSLLDKEDRTVRIAAGEALALIFEMGCLEKFAAEAFESSAQDGNKSYAHVQGLKRKILDQVKDLAAEAGGKGSAKKDLNSQRNLFRDILDYLEGGDSPEVSMKIGGDSFQTSTWHQLVQLNFLKHFLGGGFVKHMQDNECLHEVFGFAPKKKQGADAQMSSGDKRMFRSPNSFLNKARTQYMNKQRMLSEVRAGIPFSPILHDDNSI